MEFRELLYRARLGDQESIMEIFEMYRPLGICRTLFNNSFFGSIDSWDIVFRVWIISRYKRE